MYRYLAMRIRLGALKYWDVIDRFPKHKEEIDKFLLERYYMNAPKERNEEPTFIIQ